MTNAQITGPDIIDGSAVYLFYPDIKPENCYWSVEPAAMFQQSSGTGIVAALDYATPFIYLSPKATLTYTFSYSCDNSYSCSKEIDLLIPTTTISGTAISDGFVIDTNATVTVTGEIRSNYKAKTIVPTGTKLILNGGEMKSNSNTMWQGIEVWGNSNTHQQEVNGGYLQGYVELKNGATIENAKCALRLRNPLVGGTSGGIVHATDAAFRNNSLSVEAFNFTNHGTLSQRELDYNGWFYNCTFTVDTAFLGASAFHCHAMLSNVSGLQFLGCAFSADRTVDSVDLHCSGINAYNASFMVNEYCDNTILPCPANDLVRSSFMGFYDGIQSMCDGQSTRSFSVQNSDFHDNNIGVMAKNTAMAMVVENEFTVGGAMECPMGIHLEGVTGFHVEGNNFLGTSDSLSPTYGTVVKDSYAANDIYLNNFEGLRYGNLSIGCNAIVVELGGTPSVTTGLTYSCNDNTLNTVDFRIDDNGDYSGIQPWQGSPALTAGNTFSGNTWHIYNDGDYTVSYYYDGTSPAQIPDATKLYRVNATVSNNINRCVSHYGQNPVKQSRVGLDSLASLWTSAHASYEELRMIHDSIVNGNSNPNGQSDMALDLLRAEMTTYAHSCTEAAGDIIRSLVNEPGSDDAELRLWLGRLDTPDADRMAVASLLEKGDTEGAYEMASDMPYKYGPKTLDPLEHGNYMRLLNLYIELQRSGRDAQHLTEGEKTLVKAIASEGTGQSRSLATVLLQVATGERDLPLCPPDIINENRGNDKSLEDRHRGVASDGAAEYMPLYLHPNPTSGTVTVSGDGIAKAEVFNLLGQPIATQQADNGTVILDLEGLPQGIYLVNVTDKQGRKCVKKIVKE
ncbi:MAG: T9SS type A sorting domain-containing protein [Bacteroidales bacterium]|nr:T9SS type A sorting domain-containing protein [Bacteroidales bacterium]